MLKTSRTHLPAQPLVQLKSGSESDTETFAVSERVKCLSLFSEWDKPSESFRPWMWPW